MGVMSRRVLPICSILCVCCPALRARSRHPVKRYKKLLADIFPRSQGGEPNERNIGKLCAYASKNPLRMPKITDYLEQKFYKSLRNENMVSVKAVLLVYGKLLSSCKEQMPLFASSLLQIIGTLLEQTQDYEMQILGCHSLVNFINNQVNSAYMINLEGLIPKLCQLAEHVGDDERVLRLRSAGLEVLAFMVQFLGEQPHVFMDFEKIITVTLENYVDVPINQEIPMYEGVEDHRSSIFKPQEIPPMDAYKNPSYWARVCLRCMAQSAKEVMTVRRVLESLFHKFDTDKLWLPEKGIAFAVLKYLQMMLEESGDRSHLLLPILVKHLDHKDVMKQPVLQLHIVIVATQLSKYMKQHASVTIVGAIADLMKHLRKCLQKTSDTCYVDLQRALENCISNLSCKVGDVGPILDTMAVMIENISTNGVMARANIRALYQTAQVISSIPNISYLRKAFPDELFHHLLLAMSHSDQETRLVAHRVFSIVLIPSLTQPCSIHDLIPQGSLSSDPCTHDGKAASSSMRLKGHQVSLVLSSIWIQATSMENTPANIEAMTHTYTLALSFVLSKNSNHLSLLEFFQLAFSLRSISFNQQGGLASSPRRSLFTLASYMIIVCAKACHFPELIPLVRSTLTEETVDPCVVLNEDIICGEKSLYKSEASDEGCSMSAIDFKDEELKGMVSMHLLGNASEEQVSVLKAQLSQWFMPDDEYPLFMEPFSQPEFEEVNLPGTDEDAINSVDVQSVKQLLESVVETGGHVESMMLSSSTSVPYEQMKNQCEAKHHKMPVLESFMSSPNTFHVEAREGGVKCLTSAVHDQLNSCSKEYGQQQSFRLPSLSPYDKFLKPTR